MLFVQITIPAALPPLPANQQLAIYNKAAPQDMVKL